MYKFDYLYITGINYILKHIQN